MVPLFTNKEVEQQTNYDPAQDRDKKNRPWAKLLQESANVVKRYQVRQINKALKKPHPGAARESNQNSRATENR